LTPFTLLAISMGGYEEPKSKSRTELLKEIKIEGEKRNETKSKCSLVNIYANGDQTVIALAQVDFHQNDMMMKHRLGVLTPNEAIICLAQVREDTLNAISRVDEKYPVLNLTEEEVNSLTDLMETPSPKRTVSFFMILTQ
jgi:hypothetical protein